MRILKNEYDKYDLVIEVNYSVEDDRALAASSSAGDRFEKGRFDAFVVNVEKLFHRLGFQVVEQHSSDRSMSRYYAVYPAGLDDTVVYNVMIILRVSTHDMPKGMEHGYYYYNNYAQRESKLPVNEYQEWVFENVVINGDYVDSYVRALLYIRDFAGEWRLKS